METSSFACLDLADSVLDEMCSSVSLELFPNLFAEDGDDCHLLNNEDYEEILASERDDESSSSGEFGSCVKLIVPGRGGQSKVGRPRKRDATLADGLSKNAIAARENRIKKKMYVQGLEESIRILTTENKSLKSRTMGLQENVDKLQVEVKYLRGVLANVDEISALLKSVRNTSGLRVSCNVKNRSTTKRKVEKIEEEEEKDPSVLVKQVESVSNSGICFHVNSGQVSLEFCPQCSANAAVSDS